MQSFFSLKMAAGILGRSEQGTHIAHHGSVPQRGLALPFGSLGGLASHTMFSSVPEKGDGGYKCAKALEADVK